MIVHICTYIFNLYFLPLSLTVADPHTRFGFSGGHICERRLARDACTDIRHATIALCVRLSLYELKESDGKNWVVNTPRIAI